IKDFDFAPASLELVRNSANESDTCKRLYDASQVKAIWERFFWRDIHRHPKPFAVLERPFVMYSSSELEQRFLRWKKGEIACQNHCLSTQPGTPQKHLLEDSHPSTTYLLRGRWFLICEAHCGMVTYYDLDPPKGHRIECQLLIPEPFDEYSGSLMSVEEDWNTPFLAFTIVLVHISTHDWRRDMSGYCGRSRIDIWRGSLLLDERNHGRALQVEHVAQVPLLARLGEPMRSISQLDSLVTFDVRSKDQPVGSDVVIFDWKDTDAFPKCMRKTIRYDEDKYNSGVSRSLTQSNLRLLPNNRIIIANRETIDICDHSLIPKRDTRPSVCNLVPLVRIECSLDLTPSFSRTFFLPECMRLVFRKEAGIYGLTLREDECGLQAEVSELLVFPPNCRITDVGECSPHFSYNYALYWPYKSCNFVALASYDWPGECRVRKAGCSLGLYVERSADVHLKITIQPMTSSFEELHTPVDKMTVSSSSRRHGRPSKRTPSCHRQPCSLSRYGLVEPADALANCEPVPALPHGKTISHEHIPPTIEPQALFTYSNHSANDMAARRP
ncbi:hypothetical protein AN958_05716, partial [Leucoagaricus sp. SymC.cos]